MDDVFYGVRLALLVASIMAAIRYWPYRNDGGPDVFKLRIALCFTLAFMPPTLLGHWTKLGAQDLSGLLGVTSIAAVIGLVATFSLDHAEANDASPLITGAHYLVCALAGIALAMAQ